MTVVAGEESDSHPPEFAAELAGRFSRADLVIVPGATHFVPMERPEAIAAEVLRLAGQA